MCLFSGVAGGYVAECFLSHLPLQLGPVLGGRDYFTGLGVFFDTYSNHNGEHEVM